MRVASVILAILAATIPAAVSYGDMAGGACRVASAASSPNVGAVSTVATGDMVAVLGDLSPQNSLRSSLLPCSIDGLDAAATTNKPDESGSIQELPPAPSSAKLALSGLMGVAAFCVVRSARQWHFAAIPDWYHHACPDQIGHAVPAPLDLSVALMPLCRFDVVNVGAERPTPYDIHREATSRLRSQFSLPVTAPRGPPVIA